MKYLEALHNQNILFIPMAVETIGGWGLESKPLLQTEFHAALTRRNHVSPVNQL